MTMMHRRRAQLRIGLALALLVLAAPGRAAAPVQESWDAVSIAGARVGSVHAVVEPVKDRGRDRLRVRVEMALTFKRLDATVTVRMRCESIETRDGAVESLEVRTLTGNQEFRVSGAVRNGRMPLTIERVGQGRREQQSLAWGPDVRGPYGVEQSLARAPIRPGEARTLKMFLTDVNRVGEITLTAARETEEVTLAGGAEPVAGAGEKRSLLRVEQTTTLDGQPRPEFAMTLWVAPGGDVLKSFSDNLGGMVTYRTTRQAALAPAPDGPSVPFDQILSSILKVAPPIERPGASRFATYRIRLKDGDPTQIIPADRRQGWKPVGGGGGDGDGAAAILEVRTAGPDDGTPGAESAGPEYLRPGAMIDSADPKIVALARKAVGSATAPWEKAVRIEAWVAANLKDKNFAVAFASASEVARNLSGDCTEHGVLTAALCRASGVPARVVVGLVYAESLGGFGFHLWNEVYVNRRWVAIDATYHQTTVDAVHIKLADSSLGGTAPFETFLPVARVLGKMTIVPVEVR
jgi:transglutaminase-like putative cysteine protease